VQLARASSTLLPHPPSNRPPSTYTTHWLGTLPHTTTTALQANDVVTAPTAMFVEALDTVLGQMKEADFPFADVAAISGSGYGCSILGPILVARGCYRIPRELP
jgi:hypothetical protein